MHQSSLDHVRCVNCNSDLDVTIFEQTDQIDEGILKCNKCKKQYPVISSVALIVPDLSSYFSIRTKLGGDLMLRAKSKIMQDFVKNALKKTKTQEDTSSLEENWVKIYQKSANTSFYSKITRLLNGLPESNLSIEHGCSIGTVTHNLAKKSKRAFGIDKSFYAIEQAQRRKTKNCDFFVADSLCHPFGKTKFDTVVGLNLLELVEPDDLLGVLTKQAAKFLIMSDPYDYERGKKSVKKRWDEKMLRKQIAMRGFSVSGKTKKPSYLDWSLTVNPRLELKYKVDMILAKRH